MRNKPADLNRGPTIMYPQLILLIWSCPEKFAEVSKPDKASPVCDEDEQQIFWQSYRRLCIAEAEIFRVHQPDMLLWMQDLVYVAVGCGLFRWCCCEDMARCCIQKSGVHWLQRFKDQQEHTWMLACGNMTSPLVCACLFLFASIIWVLNWLP